VTDVGGNPFYGQREFRRSEIVFSDRKMRGWFDGRIVLNFGKILKELVGKCARMVPSLTPMEITI